MAEPTQPPYSNDPNARRRPWEDRLSEAGARVEDELRRAIHVLETEVVPEVRRNSSVALRHAAEQLRRLAERMETANASPAPPPPPDPARKW